MINTDAISRKQAIDTINSWLRCTSYNADERHIMKAVVSVLEDMPSITQFEGEMMDETLWRYHKAERR